MVHTISLIVTLALLLLGALPPSLAHDHGGHMASPAEAEATSSNPILQLDTMNATIASPHSYFTYPENSGLLVAHVVLMVIAWFFILPLGKLDISESYVRNDAANHRSQR